MHGPSKGLTAVVCESCGMPSEFRLPSLGPRRNLRASAWFCFPPPPTRDSSIDFCNLYSPIVYILLRKNLLIFWKPHAFQVARPSSYLPLQECPPRAGTSETPGGGSPQPSVTSHLGHAVRPAHSKGPFRRPESCCLRVFWGAFGVLSEPRLQTGFAS
jgi:hypothetical protein